MSATATPGAQTAEQILAALAAPFDASEVKFKPAVVSGNRALALHYVDARVIQDRLDAVLGVAGWQDRYDVLPDGSVTCRLRCRIDGQWITKMDVGSQSEQPDGGDRAKAAFSDALKRAAVKFGVGRYLYRLPQQWCDYDPHKKQFVRPPTLPAAARGQAPAKQPPTGAERLAGLRDYAASMGLGWRLAELLAKALGNHQAAETIDPRQEKWARAHLAVVRQYWQTPPPDGLTLRNWLGELDRRCEHDAGTAKDDVLRFARGAAQADGLQYDQLDSWTAPQRKALWDAAKSFAEARKREKAGAPVAAGK